MKFLFDIQHISLLKYVLKYKKGDPIPETLSPNTLIQLENSFFKFGDIEYNEETYLKLASLNLERIILDVLHWNPFLNFPQNYEDYTPVEIYLQCAKPRVEDREGDDKILKEFFDDRWWDSQRWWKNNKKLKIETLP